MGGKYCDYCGIIIIDNNKSNNFIMKFVEEHILRICVFCCAKEKIGNAPCSACKVDTPNDEARIVVYNESLVARICNSCDKEIRNGLWEYKDSKFIKK